MKNDNHLSIFYSKNKCTYKFYAFTIKSGLGSMSESSEFRFENSLSTNKIEKLKKGYWGVAFYRAQL